MHPVKPTREHLEQAFAHLHKSDSPVHTVDELLKAALLARLVEGTAQRLANGAQLADLLREPTGPITAHPAPTAKSTGRFPGAHPIPARRRTDTGPDLKSLAAGERPDQE